jgi:hypothetical protein
MRARAHVLTLGEVGNLTDDADPPGGRLAHASILADVRPLAPPRPGHARRQPTGVPASAPPYPGFGHVLVTSTVPASISTTPSTRPALIPT